MSLERIIKILENFGFKRIEAEVYVYLAKRGPMKAKDLAKALKIRSPELNLILESLQAKGTVTVIHDNQVVFKAVAFEKTFDRLVNDNIEQVKTIKNSWKNFESS